MLFNSYEFLFGFLPAVLLAYHVIGRRGGRQAALAWLVAASLFFYGWWNPIYLVLIVGSILFNFSCGLLLAGPRGQGRGGKVLLAFGIATNIGGLVYFKYAQFLLDSFGSLAGQAWGVEGIVLPLAISFFTFQQIAYLVDAYRGDTLEHNLLNYVLFVTFFPQLIAGPIVHHGEMLPQFMRRKVGGVRLDSVTIGLTILVMGLFKKVVVADAMGVYADPIFAAADGGETVVFLEAWAGALAFSLEIYFDFSGYSDMALGLARMFGIRLPLNFFSPYQATSIIDFWRRWHISLSRFLRDYLYIPLGGSRGGGLGRYRNIIVTMLLGGLWHGAGWTFVIWGGLHGVYLIVNHVWRALSAKLPWTRGGAGPWVSLAGGGVTFLAVVLGWVFFRAQTLGGAATLVQAMFAPGDLLAPNGWGLGDENPAYLIEVFSVIGTILVFVWRMPNTAQLMRRYRPALDVYGHLSRARSRRFDPLWRMTPVWAVVGGIGAVLAVFGMTDVSEFIYFQF